jgi:hypothetical protein
MEQEGKLTRSERRDDGEKGKGNKKGKCLFIYYNNYLFIITSSLYLGYIVTFTKVLRIYHN